MIIDRTAPEGNAYAIMGTVTALMRASGCADELPAIMVRMRSGDYNNLCRIATEVSNGSITFCDGEEDDE